jgi:tripartite-type tricarboxylate transporter receptor subunit TctC
MNRLHAGRARRFFLGLPAALLAMAVMAPSAMAQDYPNRPVRIIVPFAPGGSADVFGRFIAQRLQDALGQSFVVDNRPGAGSVIGTDAVAKAAPDGYTLLLMSNTHTVNESLIPNKPYQLMRDFVPSHRSTTATWCWWPRPAGRRQRRRPRAPVQGQADVLSYASSGPGTPYHMAGELFKAMAGFSMVHVPYKGSAGARTDVLGGQVEMMFDAIPTMTEHIRSGKVKALATTGKARVGRAARRADDGTRPACPNYEATIWLGLMAPKGTPAAVVSRLNAEIGRITGNAEVRRGWAAQGTTPMTMGVDEFAKYVDEDIVKWTRIVKLSGAKAE